MEVGIYPANAILKLAQKNPKTAYYMSKDKNHNEEDNKIIGLLIKAKDILKLNCLIVLVHFLVQFENPGDSNKLQNSRQFCYQREVACLKEQIPGNYGEYINHKPAL